MEKLWVFLNNKKNRFAHIRLFRKVLKDAQGVIIGAIGVSGSTVENDHAVAKAGADAVK